MQGEVDIFSTTNGKRPRRAPVALSPTSFVSKSYESKQIRPSSPTPPKIRPADPPQLKALLGEEAVQAAAASGLRRADTLKKCDPTLKDGIALFRMAANLSFRVAKAAAAAWEIDAQADGRGGPADAADGDLDAAVYAWLSSAAAAAATAAAAEIAACRAALCGDPDERCGAPGRRARQRARLGEQNRQRRLWGCRRGGRRTCAERGGGTAHVR